MPDNFRNAARTGSNDRNAGGRRLQQRNPQPLHHRRMNNEIQTGQNAFQIIAESGKDDLLVNAFLMA